MYIAIDIKALNTFYIQKVTENTLRVNNTLNILGGSIICMKASSKLHIDKDFLNPLYLN